MTGEAESICDFDFVSFAIYINNSSYVFVEKTSTRRIATYTGYIENG